MKRTPLLRILFAALLPVLPATLSSQETPKLVPALGWEIGEQGGFPTSIASDAQNAIWVGTEDRGVWRYDPRGKKWTQFAQKDGLGDDNIYAVAVDKLNRVWVGHLNHGVSVWNGEKWNNYGLLDGPLGDRVFAIATCPKDGDVWIATDCGLARYSLSKDEWDYFTRASGLPSNQIQCIAFDTAGNIYAGTQCDGIAIAHAADGYKKWTSVTGSFQMPDSGSGDGIPSSLINDITPVRLPAGENEGHADGIAAATPCGEAVSEDGGKTWTYIRGTDWRAKMAGLFENAEVAMDLPADDPQLRQLTEDWVTCFRQEPGTLRTWIGYRRQGVEVRNPDGAVAIRPQLEGDNQVLIRAIRPGPKAPPLVAVYDDQKGGLKTLEGITTDVEPGAEAAKTAPALPKAAAAPGPESLAPLAKRLDFFKNNLEAGEVVYLGDDWRTEGDWVGRYGNSFAMLCGLETPGRIFAGESGFQVQVTTGPHVKYNDSITHVTNTSMDNPGVLYDPTLGHRAEAEVEDGSGRRNVYASSWEGPDLWIDFQIPEGTFCVSFYFFNNDTRNGHWNKFRDYDLQLVPWADNQDTIRRAAPIARARVTDFGGGVYKQFIVAGPSRYVLRIIRNGSYVTKLQGVFIDRLSGNAPDKTKPLPGFEAFHYGPPTPDDKAVIDANAPFAAAANLWAKLDNTFTRAGTIGLQLPLRVYAYRGAVAKGAPADLLAQWRWQIALWTRDDRSKFTEAMGHAFHAYSTAKDSQPATGGQK